MRKFVLLKGGGLQQGMNFRCGGTQSVILMNQRKGAPYPDRLSEDGKRLFYFGHDAYGMPNKARLDQPLARPNGLLTPNGQFFVAAQEENLVRELVRVYEKLHEGIWAFNGLFRVVGAKMEHDGLVMCAYLS